ncbi:hypothetical protein KP509_35G043200 [Ceratopteris richardii]|uniref:NmrA-like domain-containing protein n=1 Tax=Ceratopteris richardii TaxID=49495 RepID=A0A8T2QEV0_CERRI|nr:hypothetical protein KP509_35G043200 [Ceratopteris richardii]
MESQRKVRKTKVLVIGATGNIGKHIALAGCAEGCSVFALIRPSTLSSKASLVDSLRSAGVVIVEGSLEDHESLLCAIKKVHVVITAVGSNTLDQLKIIEAIKEAGNVKRFMPSEFGNDVDRCNVHTLEPARTFFARKAQIRGAVEEAKIPYTYVVSNSFGSPMLTTLLQPGLRAPPRDEVSIYGGGNIKFVAVLEEDIATYTIKAVNDQNTLNKTMHIRPPANIMTMNSLVALWEKLIGKTLEKVTVTAEQLEDVIECTPRILKLFPAILHNIVILGDQCNFNLGPQDVEATYLYPEHKYITIEEYLSRFV